MLCKVRERRKPTRDPVLFHGSRSRCGCRGRFRIARKRRKPVGNLDLFDLVDIVRDGLRRRRRRLGQRLGRGLCVLVRNPCGFLSGFCGGRSDFVRGRRHGTRSGRRRGRRSRRCGLPFKVFGGELRGSRRCGRCGASRRRLDGTDGWHREDRGDFLRIIMNLGNSRATLCFERWWRKRSRRGHEGNGRG